MIITGDIVESGLPKEYNRAKEFLNSLSEELNVDHEYFIFIPGNHDICWLDSQRAELEQKRDEFDNIELNKRINNYKFETFKDFLNKFYSFEQDQLGRRLEHDAFIYDFDELKLSIASLNSCEVESHRETDHKGVLSVEQAQSVMDYWQKKQCDDWIKIIAIHHNPISVGHEDHEKWNSYLEEQQRNGTLTMDVVRRYLSDILGLEGAQNLKTLAEDCQVQLVLHGHQHTTNEESWPRKSGNGYIDILSAGSFGLDTDKLPKFQKNSFRLILMDIRDKKLFSTIRVYEPTAKAKGVIDQGHFVPDPSGRGVYQQQNLFLPGILESQTEKRKSEPTEDYSSFTDYANSIQSFIDNYLVSRQSYNVVKYMMY